MFAIHGETTWLFTGCNLPAVLDCQFVGIELNYFTGVFDVDEDVTLFIGRGELRFAAERDRPGHRSSLRIDCRRVFAAAIKREHAL